MKTAGSAGASFLIRDANVGAGRGESLKAGVVVSIEVRESLGSGQYRIAAGSRLLVASSTAVLEPGSMLRARVERSGDDLLLRILDAGRPSSSNRDPVAAALLKAGLPADEAGRLALTALLGAGVSPDGAAVARVRRVALRATASGRGEDSALVDLAARMEAKGLAADEAALEAIAGAGDGRGAAGSFGGRSGGRDGGSSGRDEASAEAGDEAGAEAIQCPGGAMEDGFDLDRDFERSIPGSELASRLGAFIRALALRSSGESDGATPARGIDGAVGDSLLGLFNHAKGREGGWILVPFRFALDSVAFAGSFRIQLPYVPGGPGRIDAFFDASRGDDSTTWRASLSFGGTAIPSLRLEIPEGGSSSERVRSLLGDFEASLAACGCAFSIGKPRGPAIPGAVGGGFDLDA